MAVTVLATSLATTPAHAKKVVVKMATLAPKGSVWHQALQEMGEDWKEASDGQVILRIYPGGVAGDDVDVVRKMRLGTLNAGVLTGSGLGSIDNSINIVQAPLAYRDYDELYHVLDKMTPRLAKTYEDKGFVVLNWGDGGWVYFFTKEKVESPEDLKKLKIFSWADETSTAEFWKESGFKAIALPSTELSTSLQTGLVSAVPVSPQMAVLMQWYNQLPNMTHLKWGVLVGATVMEKGTWEKIPEDVRPKLMEAADKAAKKMREETLRAEIEAIKAMEERGLRVHQVSKKELEVWQKTAEEAYPSLTKDYVPKDLFEEALRIRDEYRGRKASKTTP